MYFSLPATIKVLPALRAGMNPSSLLWMLLLAVFLGKYYVYHVYARVPGLKTVPST